MGSNFAEAHPVGFQWVMEAKHRGATVIHADPRFTRTSANASLYVPLRAGSDIAFLGGIVNHILQHDRYFREYLVAYTNAPTIINREFKDSEEALGYFSGWDPDQQKYDTATWQYQGMQEPPSAGRRDQGHGPGESSGAAGATTEHAEPPQDRTLQDPNCVFQILKRHFARYTPEFVASACGCSQEQFLKVAEALCANSGRDRTSAIVYSVGWTQHSTGVQLIRTAAIIQLLLGNIGRPGGGILALRGHASIQGSTDIPTLFNLLPGYIPMPHAHENFSLDEFVRSYASPTGGWGSMKKYLVSLLKAYWGEHATPENEFAWHYLPRIDQDDSTYQTTMSMLDGTVKGFIVVGENPAVGHANSRLHREAFKKLDWMVVRDMFEVETATYWQEDPAGCATEVFFLPAAAHTEKDGTFTNAQRLLQFHHKAVEPKGDSRSDLWFYFHLGNLVRSKLANSTEERDRPLQHLRWDYPAVGPQQEPDAEAVLKEISGWGADFQPLSRYQDLKDDGSTVCGCWIYAGCYADGVNQPARRRPWHEQDWVAAEWGWSWPGNRRLLYNRASADPDGKPWSERKKYVWWDSAEGRWTGYDTPDITPDKAPGYVPEPGARADAALPGEAPFVMQGDGKGWIFVPSGLLDGPLPVHYEPQESVIRNPLHPEVQSNPLRQQFHHPLNPYNPDHGSRFPYVLTTYRLTEHHTAGGMSRTLERLSELQPELFCEVSPELAREKQLTHGGYAVVFNERGEVEARVMVTDRMAPLRVAGKTVHQVGLPWHWGANGITTGDSANALLPVVLEPNVHIPESKVATCDIRPGRRAR